MRRRLLALHALLLVTATACSSFEGQAIGVDAGSDAPTAGGGSDASADAPGSGDATVDVSTDAATDGCVLFDGPGAPPAWKTDQMGGTVSFAPFMGRNAFEADVLSSTQRAQLVRELTIPPGGHFEVTVDLHTSAAPTPNLAWIVDFVNISCSAPDSVLQFGSGPNGVLTAEVSPAVGTSAATMASSPPSSWSTLTFGVADDAITVSFAGTTQTLKLAPSASYAKVPLCKITVGAAATGNVPATTVHVARVCISH